jgi:hypothetical protein
MNEKFFLATLLLFSAGVTIFMFGHIYKNELYEKVGAILQVLTGILMAIGYFLGGY